MSDYKESKRMLANINKINKSVEECCMPLIKLGQTTKVLGEIIKTMIEKYKLKSQGSELEWKEIGKWNYKNTARKN